MSRIGKTYACRSSGKVVRVVGRGRSDRRDDRWRVSCLYTPDPTIGFEIRDAYLERDYVEVPPEIVADAFRRVGRRVLDSLGESTVGVVA